MAVGNCVWLYVLMDLIGLVVQHTDCSNIGLDVVSGNTKDCNLSNREWNRGVIAVVGIWKNGFGALGMGSDYGTSMGF